MCDTVSEAVSNVKPLKPLIPPIVLHSVVVDSETKNNRSQVFLTIVPGCASHRSTKFPDKGRDKSIDRNENEEDM